MLGAATESRGPKASRRPEAARLLAASLVLASALAGPAAAQGAEGWLIAGPFPAASGGLADPLDLDFLASSGVAP